jgi:hypothetical protein
MARDRNLLAPRVTHGTQASNHVTFHSPREQIGIARHQSVAQRVAGGAARGGGRRLRGYGCSGRRLRGDDCSYGAGV